MQTIFSKRVDTCERPPVSAERSRSRRNGFGTIEVLESRRLLSSTPISVLVGHGNSQFVSFVDANGNQDHYTVTGGGVANIQLNGTDLVTTSAAGGSVIRGSGITVGDISVTGTRVGTRITMKVGTGSAIGTGAPITVGSITTDGPVSTLQGNVDVTGPVAIGGSLTNLTLTGLDGPGTAAVPAAPVTFTASSINSLTVSANEAENFIVSGPIGNVTIGGNLTGGFSATSMRNLRVGGNMTGSTITLSQTLSGARKDLISFSVAGPVMNSTITSAGSIGPMSAASFTGDEILAGIAAATTGLPTSSTQVVADASIFNLIAHGFASTDVAAFNIGRVVLGNVQTSNAGTSFGIASANVGPIGGTASINGRPFILRRLNNQITANSLLSRDGLRAAGVDFTVTII